MFMQNRFLPRVSIVAAFATTTLLAACGGGGGGSTAQAVAGTTFPVQAAIAKLYATGFQKTLTVSGTVTDSTGTQYPVSGTETITQSPAGATTFNGQTAYASTSTVTGSIIVNGQTLPLASTAQVYLSTSYSPLGETSATRTCIAQTPSSSPTTVTIGQTGSVVTYACSSTSSPPSPIGTESISFVVTPGNSATTATFSSLFKTINLAGQITDTEQDNYLIDTAGNMSLISATDLGGNVNLTLTAQ